MKYNENKIFILFITISLLLITILSIVANNDNATQVIVNNELDIIIVDSIPKDEICEIDIEWETFIKGLTWVESNHRDSAINKQSGASGQFQIMPIYVKEANRLQDSIKFTLEDRFNYNKSRKMFDIIQENKNPKRNMQYACRLHYGSWDKTYYNKVMIAFNYFMNNPNATEIPS